MSLNISNINATSFKGDYIKPQFEKPESNNSVDRSDILISASDCLAAANKGGLRISVSTLDNVDKAAEQSKNYFKNSIIPADEKILDGFKDGGRSGRREIICVDRKKDIKLQKIIDEVKKDVEGVVPDFDIETGKYTDKETYIFDYVKNLNKHNLDAKKLPEGKEMLLGDIIGTESASCRHFALLFKILCDEVGIKSDLVRGEIHNPKNPEESFAHAWNIVEYDDEGYSLFDCSLDINRIDYLPFYESDSMYERLNSLDVI